ncbi:MAG: hypothetical protein ABJD13_13725 [Paracoccaceae bacterium]
MTDPLKSIKERVQTRYRTALVFSVPVFVVLAVMALEAGADIVLIQPGALAPVLIVSLLIAAIPVTLYNRAKMTLDREQESERLAEIVKKIEMPQ